MSFFKSSREKRLWLYVVMVIIAILSTLAFGRPLQEMLKDQNMQAVIFLTGMILTGTTMIVHGLKVQPDKIELTIWLGLTAVYLMLFLRLGLPERSHLIEYSVLAIFIHKALIERRHPSKQVFVPALLALMITSIIGTLDEGIQLFLPTRVFDPVDIFFNCCAALGAIVASTILQWAGKKYRRNQ